MLNNQPINLEGTPGSLDIFRFANAQAAKGFSSKLPKLETPCEFYKKNKFRRFTYKNLGKGKFRLAVLTQEGKEHFAVQRNFNLCYIKLVRNFYGHY
ncbi:hypothetical protein OKE68_02775 [Riemerella anatipestifer]|uniref:Uncharacterized protein n=1 Tax=Riemerella anatipestifer TaxID=34085 RepID=A0AAP3EW03_RIEAN|nr:hypothetical protein [Riemerella anatipestifer]MBT0572777.1 hypothetical protein [Riemerella anatipestifer]MCE3024547.1 hypothetical protein [Riemerella anatipestifer]MCU7568340.1 hypothetical protein [Riemerella anatipestifer]MCW0489334.1 hypothetical protein [Riemerella anatipestifer]MCW0523241.1 hypothetical protein [Riemerella anatipestifer]